ncbi:MAG: hypothetical protein QG670_2334 [Thermoproteota archaeon]|nr:hypothetical protein [Thermoproteota archaeon]
MTEHKVLKEKLKNSERLAYIGQTAVMVGHDLRNPLQSVEGAIYIAWRSRNPSQEPRDAERTEYV